MDRTTLLGDVFSKLSALRRGLRAFTAFVLFRLLPGKTLAGASVIAVMRTVLIACVVLAGLRTARCSRGWQEGDSPK
ncbi:hypothetical protein [Limimaricola cinnabarinus]|uniref:hypothetical protein n=1 Tax=Limimaricola cinnabarinus TaxID=1125964 RepID=UPI0024905CC3|nr:hypothetical protein [Limimaricola cinnabarinus]